MKKPKAKTYECNGIKFTLEAIQAAGVVVDGTNKRMVEICDVFGNTRKIHLAELSRLRADSMVEAIGGSAVVVTPKAK